MRKLLLAALVAPFPALADDAVNIAHVGAFAGMIVMDSTVTVGGTKLVDQGGDAAQAGVRAGWGRRWPAGLYLGFEGEAFLASGRSRAVVNGQAYSLSVDGGAGAYGRVGWMTNPTGALFFARAGAQTLNTNQGWRTTPVVGFGAEVPFAAGWAARIDATYGWDDVEFYGITAGIVRRW